MARAERTGGVDRLADPLGFDTDEMRRLGYLVVDHVVDHWASLDGQAALRENDSSGLGALARPLPEGPQRVEDGIKLLADVALANMQHGGHPRYFARVPGPAAYASILGEWLSIGFNSIASSWAGGSGPSMLELTVIGWLCDVLGFPAGSDGILVSGGSMGNLTALAAARHAGFDGPVYLGDQVHSSVVRALRTLGWPSSKIRILEADESFRLPVPAVMKAMRQDIETGSNSPGIVIATAGTTNTGAVDRLEELADLCQQAHMWLHVDGAYGAPAAFTARGRQALHGIERADSLTLDPHKWLFQAYDIGCVLVRDAGVLENCFAMNPEYLRDVQSVTPGEADLRNRSPELTRRARAAKLWLTFYAHGRAGVSAAIEHGIWLAEATQSLLEADPAWEVVTPAQLGILTFARRGLKAGEHVARAAALTRSGYAAVSCTELAGRTVFRLCLINPLTTLTDVACTLDRLRAGTTADERTIR